MDKKQRIIFMGTPDYATIIFQELLENNYNIVALFTQPDKPVGRKQKLTPPHIKKFCLENGLSLPICQPNSLKDKSTIENLRGFNPDIIIVAAFGQILPKEVLDIAPCINLHASLLPFYRGASPIQQSLLNDDQYTGVTAMNMDIGLDSGDILGYKYIKIKKDTVVAELFDTLSIAAAKLTIEILQKLDTIRPKKQNPSLVSHCKKVNKKDGLIFFDDAKLLYNKYRAYKTWPDIYISSGLKIKNCELIEADSQNIPAQIIAIEKTYIIVGCKKGTIKIIDVQPQSKKQMSVVDYIRGARLEIGDNIS